ncbi:MAG: RDD family protein [Candidatus Magnetoovum sp. WYHC-5]|nr:RDD family protein [Candidatus Magnetoovum sp. WYHC-5]
MMSMIGKQEIIVKRIAGKCVDLLVAIMLMKIAYVVAIAYLLLCDGVSGGRGVGKRLLGLCVVSLKGGGSFTYASSVFRNTTVAAAFILWSIPIFGVFVSVSIILLEFVIMIGNEKKMRIGDMLARTKVLGA